MKNRELDRFGAVEKCRAVLAVWTERKNAAGVVKELGVSAPLFSQWQERALSGMLDALEPRGTKERTEEPALPVPFKRLLDRRLRSEELANLGRSMPWRNRPPKNKPGKEGTAPAAS